MNFIDEWNCLAFRYVRHKKWIFEIDTWLKRHGLQQDCLVGEPGVQAEERAVQRHQSSSRRSEFEKSSEVVHLQVHAVEAVAMSLSPPESRSSDLKVRQFLPPQPELKISDTNLKWSRYSQTWAYYHLGITANTSRSHFQFFNTKLPLSKDHLSTTVTIFGSQG